MKYHFLSLWYDSTWDWTPVIYFYRLFHYLLTLKSVTKKTAILQLYIHVYIYRTIVIMVRVFANGPGDRGSIPGRVIPKTFKMVLNAFLFNTLHYVVRFKVSERCCAPPTLRCSSKWKGSLLVILDYGRGWLYI